MNLAKSVMEQNVTLLLFLVAIILHASLVLKDVNAALYVEFRLKILLKFISNENKLLNIVNKLLYNFL